MSQAPPQRIILFDGVCNFCNYGVQFALKRDKTGLLQFAPLQGETAKVLLPRYDINPTNLTSVVLIDGDKAYTQSSAALRICRYLKGGWPLLYGFIIVPRFLRDAVYNFLARNRYRWFGKKDSCMVPTSEIRHRFLP
jgi:predicted DCC family thiol-disulfide oxidoreductase YuxK